MLRNILQRIDNLLLIRTKVSYNGEIDMTASGESGKVISGNIINVDKIIYYEVEKMLEQYSLSSHIYSVGNEKGIIKSFIMSEINQIPYPRNNDSDEQRRVEKFFTPEQQSQIIQSSKTLVQELGRLLREVLVPTLNKLKELDDPERHIQWFLQLVLVRLTVYIGNHIYISSFQRFIDNMNIEI